MTFKNRPLCHRLYSTWSLLALLLVGAVPVCGATSYRLTDLGLIVPTGINESKQVSAYQYSSTANALLWQRKKTTVLPSLGGGALARGINQSGTIVGESFLAGENAPYHAALWCNAKVTDLGTLGGDYGAAYAINDAGKVVGHSSADQQGLLRATLWNNGAVIDLGTLGGPRSTAYAINEAGNAVGEADLPGMTPTTSGYSHATLWHGSGLTDLGTLGGSFSSARGINNKGQIVGFSMIANDSVFHAALWEDGKVFDLGAFNGELGYSEASAINSAGTIVGNSTTKDFRPHATVWFDKTPTDLNFLLASNHPRFTLIAATDINDAGQIVGVALGLDDRQHGFLLTPVKKHTKADNQDGEEQARADVADDEESADEADDH